jgi:hypothetical protein
VRANAISVHICVKLRHSALNVSIVRLTMVQDAPYAVRICRPSRTFRITHTIRFCWPLVRILTVQYLLPPALIFFFFATVLKAFPDAHTERGRAIEAEERDARLDTPIFVCQLAFPGMPTLLHFFEPRCVTPQ